MTTRRPIVLVSGTPQELPAGDDLVTGAQRGSSFPASPTEGDLFYHTGRDVLYQYVTSWVPIRGYSAISLALNASGDGDAWNTAAGGGATTLALVLAEIPTIQAGNVTIYVRAGSYAASTAFVALPAAYSFVIVGDLTTTATLTANATGTTYDLTTGTLASVTVSTTLTANAYRGKILRIGTTYYPIVSNTTDTIVIGTAWNRGLSETGTQSQGSTPTNGTTLEVLTPAATFNSGSFRYPTSNSMTIRGVAISSDQTLDMARISFDYCVFTGVIVNSRFTSNYIRASSVITTSTSDPAIQVRYGGWLTLYSSVIAGGPGALSVETNGTCLLTSCSIQQTVGTSSASAIVKTGGSLINQSDAQTNGSDFLDPVNAGGYALTLETEGTLTGLPGTYSRIGSKGMNNQTLANYLVSALMAL